MLSWVVLNKIQLFFLILASFLVKKIMRLKFEDVFFAQFFFVKSRGVFLFFSVVRLRSRKPLERLQDCGL